MKAGLAVGAALASLVIAIASCSPDRIPGSPVSAEDRGVSFASNGGSGSVATSSGGCVLSSSASSTTSSGCQGSGSSGSGGCIVTSSASTTTSSDCHGSGNGSSDCATNGWTYASGSSGILGSQSGSTSGSTSGSGSIPPGKCNRNNGHGNDDNK
jgi:hypothetical protein